MLSKKDFRALLAARLIQGGPWGRNNDSKDRLAGFDRCEFLFYRLFTATFSTASTQSGHRPRDISAMQNGA
jgi:hypothetical protein